MVLETSTYIFPPLFSQTNLDTSLGFLDEPWGPTPTALPSIASAFIPHARASSPDQFSTASSRSEQQELLMDLDAPIPSPSPSDISDVSATPSLDELQKIILDDVRRDIFTVCQEINISPGMYNKNIFFFNLRCKLNKYKTTGVSYFKLVLTEI